MVALTGTGGKGDRSITQVSQGEALPLLCFDHDGLERHPVVGEDLPQHVHPRWWPVGTVRRTGGPGTGSRVPGISAGPAGEDRLDHVGDEPIRLLEERPVTRSVQVDDILPGRVERRSPCCPCHQRRLPALFAPPKRGTLEVVVGTSGLTDDDYAEIDAAAQAAGKGVLAAGNFALTVVLLMKFAEAAAKLIPHWEIIDYARDTKADAPSGTVRELAGRLGRVAEARQAVSVEDTLGEKGTRGATMGGAQVHAVRLPGFTLSTEVMFGLPDQRISIRTDAGASAEPYVDGALIAIRKVGGFVGLRRGLDSVLEL